MAWRNNILYLACRALLKLWLHLYFSFIDRFHPERVPLTGPVLFVSNHPNSLTDAFVIGASVRRKVNFVATIQLFRWAPLRWFLLRCGVIPINRVKDDARAMRTVQSTFEECYRVLEQGEAIAIFPEGITHDDPQLKTVKTGAARMALEIESRHKGGLGLQIVPVGLSFSAKEKYRSDVLVNFGEPIRPVEWLAKYSENRHECIRDLNEEIESRIQQLMLHLPKLERAQVVEGVKKLYLERLRVGNTVIQEPATPLTEELLLTKAIANAVDFSYVQHPALAENFSRRLRHYLTTLQRMRLPEEVLIQGDMPGKLLRRCALFSLLAMAGFPVAVVAWAHRLIPYELTALVVRKSEKTPRDKTHVSTAAIIAGPIIFAVFYGLCVLLCWSCLGWHAAVIYAAVLPIVSLAGHYYARHLRTLSSYLRGLIILIRCPSAARKVRSWRAELIQQIEGERRAFTARDADRIPTD